MKDLRGLKELESNIIMQSCETVQSSGQVTGWQLGDAGSSPNSATVLPHDFGHHLPSLLS